MPQNCKSQTSRGGGGVMGSGAGVSRLTPAVEVPAQLEVEVGEVAEGGDEGGPPLFQRLPVLLLETAQQGRH